MRHGSQNEQEGDPMTAMINALLDRASAARTLDAGLLHDVANALRPIFPKAPNLPEALSDPTEAVLHLIDRCLPTWTISLTGKAIEPDGHWRCYLRETTGRDDDAVIGHGQAPVVTLALLQALLRVAVVKAG
jgi:hypothetical protein